MAFDSTYEDCSFYPFQQFFSELVSYNCSHVTFKNTTSHDSIINQIDTTCKPISFPQNLMITYLESIIWPY